MLRYPDSYRRNPMWLENLPLADGKGRLIPASLVSRIEERSATNELARENQQPLVSVTAGLGDADLGTAARSVRAALDKIPLPNGVRTKSRPGRKPVQGVRQPMVVLGLACALVFLLLVIHSIRTGCRSLFS